jgi:hypothetical protein
MRSTMRQDVLRLNPLANESQREHPWKGTKRYAGKRMTRPANHECNIEFCEVHSYASDIVVPQKPNAI